MRFIATTSWMACFLMKCRPIATPATHYFRLQFLYYESLTNSVREKAGARITVLNPGTYSPSDCWMGITNILMNWEDQGLARL